MQACPILPEPILPSRVALLDSVAVGLYLGAGVSNLESYQEHLLPSVVSMTGGGRDRRDYDRDRTRDIDHGRAERG